MLTADTQYNQIVGSIKAVGDTLSTEVGKITTAIYNKHVEMADGVTSHLDEYSQSFRNVWFG